MKNQIVTGIELLISENEKYKRVLEGISAQLALVLGKQPRSGTGWVFTTARRAALARANKKLATQRRTRKAPSAKTLRPVARRRRRPVSAETLAKRIAGLEKARRALVEKRQAGRV